MRVKRAATSAFFLVACLSLLLCCCPITSLVGATSPMHLVFLAEFQVVNESGETVYITPVGTLRGQRYVLHQYSSRLPGIPALRRGDIRLDPGESVRVVYDADDVVSSEIALRNARGKYRQLVIGGQQKHLLTFDGEIPENVYTIGPFDELSEIDDEVLAAVKEVDRSNLRAWGLFLLGIVPGFIPIGLFLAWSGLALKARRESRYAEPWGAPIALGEEQPDSQLADKRKGFASSPGELTQKQYLLAILLAGLLLTFGLTLLVTGPDYLGRLILPNDAQPLGWFMTATFLVLIGMAYASSLVGFALWDRLEPGSWILDFVTAGLFIAGILCLFFAMSLIAFGPAILTVQASIAP